MNPKGKEPTKIDRLLTAEEAAPILGLKPKAFKDLIKRGLLPIVKLGHLNRIRESDLYAFIATLPLRNVKGQTENGEPQ